MIAQLFYIAKTEATVDEAQASGDVLGSLGIDVKLLIFQLVAFTLLVWVMSKYVFPILIRAVDKRRELNESSVKAALEAEKRAEATQAEVGTLLKKARKEASDIVSTAKTEAADVVQKAEDKSRTHAERIVTEARESIDKEVIAARKSLHNEMIDLVTAATEKVTSKAVSEKVDQKLVNDALKGEA